jgi:hypothetical protein
VADEVPEPSADWELLTTTERYLENVRKQSVLLG